MTEPSDTPRCDELIRSQHPANALRDRSQMLSDCYAFARQLERDLAAARSELAALMAPCQIDGCHYSELRKACDTLVTSFADMKAARDRLAAENATLKRLLRQWRFDFGDSSFFTEDSDAMEFLFQTDAALKEPRG